MFRRGEDVVSWETGSCTHQFMRRRVQLPGTGILFLLFRLSHHKYLCKEIRDMGGKTVTGCLGWSGACLPGSNSYSLNYGAILSFFLLTFPPISRPRRSLLLWGMRGTPASVETPAITFSRLSNHEMACSLNPSCSYLRWYH